MIVAGILYAMGAVCTWAILLLANHGAPDAEPKFSGQEIIWNGIFWPLAVIVWAALSFFNWCERGVS